MICECRHTDGAHQHYRRGTDCSVCDCPEFRPLVGPVIVQSSPQIAELYRRRRRWWRW